MKSTGPVSARVNRDAPAAHLVRTPETGLVSQDLQNDRRRITPTPVTMCYERIRRAVQ
jgi:hypothetical protein